MLWLVWHMWILLLLAFAGGVIAGWILRSRSDEAPELPALTAAPARPAADPEPAAEAPPAPHVPVPEAEEGASRVAAAFTAPEPGAADESSPPAAPKGSDDLTAIKGLGPKAAEKLQAAGVTTLSQIAAWSAADIEKFDEVLNARGRIARDEWVSQAKALSKE
jgi:predicted flap endonuclease-1-like 5' DNA nuclease